MCLFNEFCAHVAFEIWPISWPDNKQLATKKWQYITSISRTNRTKEDLVDKQSLELILHTLGLFSLRASQHVSIVRLTSAVQSCELSRDDLRRLQRVSVKLAKTRLRLFLELHDEFVRSHTLTQ